MTKKVVLVSLKERINNLIDHSYRVEFCDYDFERIYKDGYRNAMQEVLTIIEDYE